MEFILFCDESSEKGEKYGDFFGGCIVNSCNLNLVVKSLEQEKQRLNLNGEVKWTKVTMQYVEKYIALMDLFFSYVKSGQVKVRIMFRKVSNDVQVHYSSDDKYFKLYYQFIKHAFGLTTIPESCSPAYLRIYLDQLPDSREKCAEFKKFLLLMPNTVGFSKSCLRIREGDIADVCSHDHVLLQCVDIVLGAMYFRLNDLHKAIPDGKKRRGHRTIAKEMLYNHINHLICEIKPRFNIGVSTSSCGYNNPHWECPYQHWEFKPKEIK